MRPKLFSGAAREATVGSKFICFLERSKQGSAQGPQADGSIGGACVDSDSANPGGVPF
jgi:hypothetical protein